MEKIFTTNNIQKAGTLENSEKKTSKSMNVSRAKKLIKKEKLIPRDLST